MLVHQQTVPHLLREFPEFRGARMFIIVFTTARHMFPSLARSIQSTSSHLQCRSVRRRRQEAHVAATLTVTYYHAWYRWDCCNEHLCVLYPKGNRHVITVLLQRRTSAGDVRNCTAPSFIAIWILFATKLLMRKLLSCYAVDDMQVKSQT